MVRRKSRNRSIGLLSTCRIKSPSRKPAKRAGVLLLSATIRMPAFCDSFSALGKALRVPPGLKILGACASLYSPPIHPRCRVGLSFSLVLAQPAAQTASTHSSRVAIELFDFLSIGVALFFPVVIFLDLSGTSSIHRLCSCHLSRSLSSGKEKSK